MTRLYGLVV
jgi:hypothetical protein